MPLYGGVAPAAVIVTVDVPPWQSIGVDVAYAITGEGSLMLTLVCD